MAERGSPSLFAGRIQLAQPQSGHRVGTDAVLLAAAAPLEGVRRAVDLGAGVGAVGLLHAVDNPGARVRLMEIDPASASLARANVDANGLAERVTVVEGDALRPSSVTPTADLVLTNPPYLSAGRARISSAKTGAHEMPPGQLDLWAKAALRLLSGRGRLVLVHRAEVLPELLQVLCGRFGALAVRPVLPRADQQAIRILVFGTKGSRGPFRILPPLVLHEPDGTFTPLAAAIHRGEARLSWN